MNRESSDRRSLMQALVASRMRMTSQRKILIQTIQEAEGHLDAAMLLELARRRNPQIDRATVYRTLKMLKKLNLVDELDLMHLHGEKHYYEARTTRDHAHLTCIQCGKVEEIVNPVFERLLRQIARESGFEIRVTRLEVGGHCSVCRNGSREGISRKTS